MSERPLNTKLYFPPPEGRGPITPRQYEAYRAVREFIVRHGYPPSVRDVARMTEVKTRTYGAQVIKVLIDRGWLRRHGRKSRSLVPVDPIRCPHCGQPVISWDAPHPPPSVPPPPKPKKPPKEPDPAAAVRIASLVFGPQPEDAACPDSPRDGSS